MLKKLLAGHLGRKSQVTVSVSGPEKEEAEPEADTESNNEGGRKRSSSQTRENRESYLTSTPTRRQTEKVVHQIPKDAAAWLELLVQLVKRRTTIDYLSDKELRKVIIRARPNLAEKKPLPLYDRDAPICLGWSIEEVGGWIASAGFPFLKEAFIANQISGRRLVTIDASALNQMGMRDLGEMRKVTAAIRALLDIPRPNMLRALLRIPPYESFLHAKVRTGSRGNLTFAQYCEEQGFNYSKWKYTKNLNALISCTCEVRIAPDDLEGDDNEDFFESDGEDVSLLNAPTVEFVVRNMVIRDIALNRIIETLLETVFSPEASQKYANVQDAFVSSLDNWESLSPEERLKLATSLAHGLLEELERTAAILQDIDELQRHIKETVTPERLAYLRECAGEFMERVVPICSLLALGQLDLESIFRDEPSFGGFVDGIIAEAEELMTGVEDKARATVSGVVKTARNKVRSLKLGVPADVQQGLSMSIADLSPSGHVETGFFGLLDEKSVGEMEGESEEMASARSSAHQLVTETIKEALSSLEDIHVQKSGASNKGSQKSIPIKQKPPLKTEDSESEDTRL